MPVNQIHLDSPLTCGADCDSDRSTCRSDDHHRSPTRPRSALRRSAKECLGYSNPEILNQLVERHGKTPEQAQSMFADCLRFLYLAATSGKSLSPPPLIDEVWHCFILNTRAYGQFCEEYFRAFIHHTPTPSGNRNAKGPVVRDTLCFAEAEFGTLSENWKPATR